MVCNLLLTLVCVTGADSDLRHTIQMLKSNQLVPTPLGQLVSSAGECSMKLSACPASASSTMQDAKGHRVLSAHLSSAVQPNNHAHARLSATTRQVHH